MSEYELLESFTSFQGLLQGWIMAAYSGTAAYLVTAYLAGSKLTRSQVAVVNLVFVVFSSLCLLSAHGNFARMLELVAEIQDLNPERAFPTKPWMMWAMTANGALVILFSVKFMWDVRHRPVGPMQRG